MFLVLGGKVIEVISRVRFTLEDFRFDSLKQAGLLWFYWHGSQPSIFSLGMRYSLVLVLMTIFISRRPSTTNQRPFMSILSPRPGKPAPEPLQGKQGFFLEEIPVPEQATHTGPRRAFFELFFLRLIILVYFLIVFVIKTVFDVALVPVPFMLFQFLIGVLNNLDGFIGQLSSSRKMNQGR